MKSIYTIRLIIPSRSMDVRLLGLSIRAISELAPVGDSVRYQLELSVVEACNNIVQHAYLGRDDGRIELSVEIFNDRIVLILEDQGAPLVEACHPNFQPPDPADILSLPENGMGVYLLQSIMDEMEYTCCDGVNRLTLVKYFIPPDDIS